MRQDGPVRREIVMRDFDGLVALVTGGASGIGRATVAELRARGATVASLDRDPAPAGEADLTLTADVTDRVGVEEAVAALVADTGRLDVVVCNAGVGATGDVTGGSDDDWLRLFDVNVLGIRRVVAAALPHLRRSPSAAIVTTSSSLAILGVPARAMYATTKGAVAALTLAMAADHVGEGIRVNAVLPGTTDTPWVGRLLAATDDPEAAAAALRARQPLGRLVTPAEVATAIAFLASPRNAAATGVLLPIDGGMTSLRLPSPPPPAG
jgi:2-keto-3-deoxy-L-fuconate dehydrogenase